MKLCDIEDCNECPLKDEFSCPGGWACYGGEPIEPPCACWTDEELEMDVEEYIDELHRIQITREEYERHLWEQEQEKKRKNEIAAKKRSHMRSYCTKERLAVKSLKKRIKSYEKIEQLASSMAEAVNVTNKMFGYAERRVVNPAITDTLQSLYTELEKAELKLKEKQKECRKTEKYKAIGKESKK